MRRREFLSILGGAAAARPLAAHAQRTGKVARIGFLGSATAVGSAKSVDAFRAGLRDLGYVEGKNIVIEFRWADTVADMPKHAAELVGTKVDV